MSPSVTVVVLAGGSSRRFGSDKLAARLGDRSVLEHCLSGMPPAWPLVVVGPPRAVPVPARFVREVPAGGGPLAGVAAGLAAATSDVVGPSRAVPVPARFVQESPAGGGPLAGVAAGLAAASSDVVCLAPGDTPRAGEVLPLLVAALAADPTVEAAVLVDGEGRANPLLGAYRSDALRQAMPADPEGRPARTLLSIPHRRVDSPFDVGDVDTPDDLDRVRRTLGP